MAFANISAAKDSNFIASLLVWPINALSTVAVVVRFGENGAKSDNSVTSVCRFGCAHVSDPRRSAGRLKSVSSKQALSLLAFA